MNFLFVALMMIVMVHGVAYGQEGGRSSDGRYTENGKGVVKDTQTGLMWTKKDSYSDLGECLDWNDSVSYVDNLVTGGYSDWRLPTVKELKTIFETSKSLMSHTHDHELPLHLDPIFAPGGAYGYWSSEEAGSCCARYLQFNFGNVGKRDRNDCDYRGARAVRP